MYYEIQEIVSIPRICEHRETMSSIFVNILHNSKY